jgi:tRNA (cytidine/uridine-2'-O-)-methyltransferase
MTPMLHIVLVHPQIPPNTGNVIRLCANTGAQLHLIHPLGFPIDHAKMRRAGLDYHEFATVRQHASVAAFLDQVRPDWSRCFAFTTKGARSFADLAFQPGDVLFFGSETTGLPDDVLQLFVDNQRLRLPMRPGNRSVNLSNAVAVAVYEAWRQHGFADLNVPVVPDQP